mmetsp:Transcript_36415/g.108088  ORF Transcript_36415/g.108088 Transcript_36415/m.108088 type:complete len:304 (-) Transcript_36415:556-1467(-)
METAAARELASGGAARSGVARPKHEGASDSKATIDRAEVANWRGGGGERAGACTERLSAPALVVLTAGAGHLDVLAVTADDVEELSGFLSSVGMPSWVGASLGSQGLRLPLLQSLPMLQIVAAAKRAGLALGLRERLKHAVRCTFGVPLAPPTLPRSPPAAERARRRVFALPRPVSMVVLLSPGLPCRLEPSLSAAAVCWRRAGDVVVAVATCEGWLELLAGGGGGAREHRRRRRSVQHLDPDRCAAEAALRSSSGGAGGAGRRATDVRGWHPLKSVADFELGLCLLLSEARCHGRASFATNV